MIAQTIQFCRLSKISIVINSAVNKKDKKYSVVFFNEQMNELEWMSVHCNFASHRLFLVIPDFMNEMVCY